MKKKRLMLQAGMKEEVADCGDFVPNPEERADDRLRVMHGLDRGIAFRFGHARRLNQGINV